MYEQWKRRHIMPISDLRKRNPSGMSVGELVASLAFAGLFTLCFCFLLIVLTFVGAIAIGGSGGGIYRVFYGLTLAPSYIVPAITADRYWTGLLVWAVG